MFHFFRFLLILTNFAGGATIIELEGSGEHAIDSLEDEGEEFIHEREDDNGHTNEKGENISDHPLVLLFEDVWILAILAVLVPMLVFFRECSS